MQIAMRTEVRTRVDQEVHEIYVFEYLKPKNCIYFNIIPFQSVSVLVHVTEWLSQTFPSWRGVSVT